MSKAPVSAPLAEILNAHRFDIAGAVCSCGVQCGVKCDNLTYLQHLDSVLGERFSIVELPEEREEHFRSYSEHPEYWGPLNSWISQPNLKLVKHREGGERFVAEDVRAEAAAMIAAAKRVEADDD